MNQNRKITVYEANSREKIGFIKGWITMYRNIIDFREMIYVLFKRDFFALYKKSFLGISWVFVAPIFSILSWVFINATGILQPGDVGMPYPAYVLLSTSIWGLFMGFYTSAQGTLTAGAGIINQVNYPHEILLVKQIAQHLANSTITLLMNIIILLLFGIVPSWKIIFLPILLLPLLFLGAGIGLVISVFSVVAPEVQKAADLLMGLLIWVTPVIYSSKFGNPIIQSIIQWNPLTFLIGGSRDVIVKGILTNPDKFLISAAFSIIVFLISWRIFYVTEDKVIEKILS
jgi:lipopolysaccharide transport system permease protein